MPIGIESAHGFGDAIFNIPLIKAACKKYQSTALVAVETRCKDAFYNIDYITKIIEIDRMGQGINILKNLGCSPIIQATQHIHFWQLHAANPKFSLIDVPAYLGNSLGIEPFDQRPIFIPTDNELQVGLSICDEKTIAIESYFMSNQSWTNNDDIIMIIEKYIKTHKILWLSNTTPLHPDIENVSKYTRRELIVATSKCETLFSVGSAFFCAAMTKVQPAKIVCMWNDTEYNYIDKLNTTKWHNNITWLLSRKQLKEYL